MLRIFFLKTKTLLKVKKFYNLVNNSIQKPGLAIFLLFKMFILEVCDCSKKGFIAESFNSL